MSSQDPFHDGIIECLPHLRGFAHLLARNHALAEDLVQETVLRALTYRAQFKPGTNLRGWLIIILRNRYFNEVRKNNRKRGISSDSLGLEQAVSGGQEEHIEIRDFKTHFAQLPERQKEALLLVGLNGFSYEEAATIANCAIGTMKSRVSRARMYLQSMMAGEISADAEPPQAAGAEVRSKS